MLRSWIWIWFWMWVLNRVGLRRVLNNSWICLVMSEYPKCARICLDLPGWLLCRCLFNFEILRCGALKRETVISKKEESFKLNFKTAIFLLKIEINYHYVIYFFFINICTLNKKNTITRCSYICCDIPGNKKTHIKYKRP